jgi:NAD(P)-dependent dehydrogenase (short-subunit alcohol dehydrogenase family)
MSYLLDMFSLGGKVAVVTGGTGVLGNEMCRALSQAGAKVVIIGRRKDAADALANELISLGGEALGISADVLDKNRLEEARKIIIDNFGGIDILVNGAGGNVAGAVIPPDKSFLDLNMEDFDKVVGLNLTGTVLPSLVFGKSIIEKKRGVIINISSMAAFRPLTRIVGYAAAKASVSNFTQWLAVEMARKYGEGIRVNAIAPGFFITEQNRKLLTTAEGGLTDRGQSIINSTPFGRFGEADELSSTLIWLCCDASKFVSGVVVPVDGAFSSFSGV